jgi:hypothetical protein
MVDTATPRLPLVDAPWVDDSFVRRVRALLRTAPLHDLEAGKGQRDGDWAPYDLRGLALAAIDTVIDHMGLEFGATGRQVRRRLVDLARMSAPDRPADEAGRVADAVLGGLLNDRHRRAAFTVGYSDWSGRHHRRAELAFKLLDEVEAPDGTVVLRATDEAVNLFVGALDRDIADAHAAAEAVLASQLRRGRLDQAVHTARAARLRSIQYTAGVERVLDATRHDIRQVDWRGDVPDLLADALGHLDERLETEQHLITTVRTLVDGHEPDRAAVTLLDLIEDCQVRHLELHALLLQARSTFMAEQERQRFAVAADPRALELGEEVLAPALTAPAERLAPAGARFLATAVGPQPPRPVRLVDLVDLLLQPRRDEAADGDGDGTPDLEAVGDEARYPADAWRWAERIMAGVPAAGEVRLSALLADARATGSGSAELVALAALHAFAPEHATAPVRAIDDGRTLDDPQFGGRDLVLTRGSAP